MDLNKNIKKDDLDLSKLFSLIFYNKLKITLFTILITIIVSIHHFTLPENKISYKVTAEIRSISVFDEVKYTIYNSFIEKAQSDSVSNRINYSFPKYIRIDAEMLRDLFIEEILQEMETDDYKQYSLFEDAIKKFEMVDKENYEKTADFEKQIELLASLTEMNYYKHPELLTNVEFRVLDKKNNKNFIKFIEESINERIRLKLQTSFKNQIKIQKNLRKSEIENIKISLNNEQKNYDFLYNIRKDESNKDHELKIIDSFTTLNNLKLKLNFLTLNPDLSSIEKIISASPINDGEPFYAAKLVETKNLTVNSYKGPPFLIKIIMAGIFGFILGIFYISISNSLLRRGN